MWDSWQTASIPKSVSSTSLKNLITVGPVLFLCMFFNARKKITRNLFKRNILQTLLEIVKNLRQSSRIRSSLKVLPTSQTVPNKFEGETYRDIERDTKSLPISAKKKLPRINRNKRNKKKLRHP